MKGLFVSFVCAVFAFAPAAARSSAQPVVHLIATGGTIAGVGTDATAAAYRPGALGVERLVAAVPQLETVADVVPEQLFNVASQDLTARDWLRLAARVNELLRSDSVDAVVITHGTDVLEETAFFLQLAVNSPKPVVLVGAMRPATALSADGPRNLYDAVTVAADTASAGRGVLAVLNGDIFSADDATKTHTLAVESFQAPETGPVGTVYGGSVRYPEPPSVRKAPFFDLFGMEELPRVAVLYGHADEAPEPVAALVKAGYDGIVHAGVGHGNIPAALFPPLEQAVRKGIPVVRATRVPRGPVTPEGEVDDARFGFVAARGLSPHKARILLMLALTRPHDRETLQRWFDRF